MSSFAPKENKSQQTTQSTDIIKSNNKTLKKPFFEPQSTYNSNFTHKNSTAAQFKSIQQLERTTPLDTKMDFGRTFKSAPEALLQNKSLPEPAKQFKPQPNNIGLPDTLKSGIENLSGLSMDDVKVHYNSSKPLQLNALAYTEGTDIHVAPGQEQHLPHEAWHVVQQAQGKVQPTMQLKNEILVNDDNGLENEADVMGARALTGVLSQANESNQVDVKNIQNTNELQSHQFKTKNIIQFDFEDRAIDKLKQAGERDEDKPLGMTVCGDSARWIYNILADRRISAGKGQGIESLCDAIQEASSRENQVFIYLVDADIVGHFFTILQHRNEAVIIQGYLEKISIADNIKAGGGAHKKFDISALIYALTKIVTSRDKLLRDGITFSPDVDIDALIELGGAHASLFGVGLDDKELYWIKRQILSNKDKVFSWQASFAEGEGNPIYPRPRKCYLTSACVNYMGLPDNCNELTTLRKFRDEYMQKSPSGKELISEYYEIAPSILDVIHELSKEQKNTIWKYIYTNIKKCEYNIIKKRYRKAIDIYKSMVKKLADIDRVIKTLNSK